MKRYYLTGAHGTGKTYILTKVKEHLEDLGFRVNVVNSVMRDLRKTGYIGDSTPVTSAQIIGYQEWSRRFHKDYPKMDIVLADRGDFDFLAYSEAYFGDDTSTRFITNKLLESVVSTNARFYKPILESAVFEDDGIRFGQKSQKLIDDNIRKHTGVGTKTSLVTELDADRDVAASQMIDFILDDIGGIND